MTEYPKTYLVKDITSNLMMLGLYKKAETKGDYFYKFSSLFFVLAFLGCVVLIPFLATLNSGVLFVAGILIAFIFPLVLLVIVTNSTVTFKLFADRLEYSNWVVRERLLFSEASILFDRKSSKAFFMRRNTIWMPFLFLPDILLEELLELLPPVPVYLREVGNATTGTYRPPKEDAFSKARLAAIAFAYLEDSNKSKAFVARQALINVSEQDPGYLPNKASSDKIREWKNWLAGEYGEQIEACAFHLEQNLVKQAWYYIVLPGIIIGVAGFVIPWWVPAIIAPFVVAVGICVLYNKVLLLFRHRSIARMVRLWRSNDSGMDLPPSAPKNPNNFEGGK